MAKKLKLAADQVEDTTTTELDPDTAGWRQWGTMTAELISLWAFGSSYIGKLMSSWSSTT